MGNTNGEKVAAIRQAWRELMPEEPLITYGAGPAVDLDLYAPNRRQCADGLAQADLDVRPAVDSRPLGMS